MVLQPITSFLLHPIIFYLVENLVTTLVIGFTSPSSIVRPAVFPLHFVCVWKVLPTCPEMLYRIPWAGIVGGHIIVSLYHYVEVALISKWSFESQGPTSSATPEGLDVKDKPNGGDRATRQMDHGVSFWERLMFGYFGATSTRNIGTPYIVKNTPSFSSKNPDYIPSRAAFLLRKAILIISAFLVVDLASQPAQTLEQNAVLYSAETVPILGGNGENLTGEKILSRFVTVLGYWVCTWLVIDGYSSFLYFVFVGLGLEDVRLYRPNFGPISEAYSIRQFWG
ncbi:hypothetical protein MMC24_005531 [Lignoscripta atroalba]|nr:hypothetical protein [Lignoscripta atroalba]